MKGQRSCVLGTKFAVIYACILKPHATCAKTLFRTFSRFFSFHWVSWISEATSTVISSGARQLISDNVIHVVEMRYLSAMDPLFSLYVYIVKSIPI